MTLNAPPQRCLRDPASTPRRRLQLCATIVALSVTACSGAQVSDHAPGQLTLRVAEAALTSGAPEMALRVADIILAKRPQDAPALIARGDALYALGRKDQAEATYRAAVAIDPAAVGAQVGIGRVLARSDPRAAEAVFQSALAREPDNVIALNNLGVVLDMQGRHGEAQTAYSRALTVAPASSDVQINLGMSLALSGHSIESVQLLRGVAAQPGNVQAWRKELVAGLTLAGDGPWAQKMLQSGSFPAGQGPTFGKEEVQLTSAAASSPAVSDAAEHAPAEPTHATPTARNGKPRGASLAADPIHDVPESLAAIALADIHNPAPDPAPRMAVAAADLAALALATATPPAAIKPVLEITTTRADRPPTERDPDCRRWSPMPPNRHPR
jgi:Flp pilus assembly protein TadD